MPESFSRLRQALEQRHGVRTGARQFIRVLQLLAEHPLERVQQAVEQCLPQPPLDAERIIAVAARLAKATSTVAATQAVALSDHSSVTPLCQYQVPSPDLGCFDQLLSQGEQDDDC